MPMPDHARLRGGMPVWHAENLTLVYGLCDYYPGAAAVPRLAQWAEALWQGARDVVYSMIVKGRPSALAHLVLALQMWDLLTDTHGYVARDDKRKEVVVAFRGSVTPANFITDALGALVEWDTARTKAAAPEGTKAHFGFQHAWCTIAEETVKIVTAELAAHPGYSIVTTGHSLGGALASMAAVILQTLFPTTAVRLYTYGQPRVGNAVFAAWVNTAIGPERSFRVVHTFDGVPTMASEWHGYMHHSTEYWSLSPHSPQQTRICNGAGLAEDPQGSKKIPCAGINPPHLSMCMRDALNLTIWEERSRRTAFTTAGVR
ncbi:Alpha/Beta hydrolase protein [Mycena pura]|uniref:Alpha/Beta hydrolase protein n=1 Tax=Mycena pura TaxID=153505 RepID=A0AAD6VVL4_9AGAR|nr:Alpha/Beta hydrolase protein [Mycena pura]